ncbi:alpha-galactosidase [Treponema sp. J25]|uniref:alpha-galactosidase n=1 Tax=Treponema sp. J25 TaxID=2094121 RepID=UPI00104C9946|nr:alpha-galactosidase [Treponema sp. J25]TCW62186.1 alpha-galactosidase [Treponema sp. J25]
MKILYHENCQEFHLQNEGLSYVLAILPNGEVGLRYIGCPLDPDRTYGYLERYEGRGMGTHQEGLPFEFCLDWARREYPTSGRGDYRQSALDVSTPKGQPLFPELRYVSHEIQEGKPELLGLPVSYAEKSSDAMTLVLTCIDGAIGIEARLFYTIFGGFPIIARRVEIKNKGSQRVMLRRVMSCACDLDDSRWVWYQFSGAWARERQPFCTPLRPGIQAIGSTRGSSSAQHNPSCILARPETTEDHGEALGVLLLYSGNHSLEVEVGSHGDTRIVAGINPWNFSWTLVPEDRFATPEVLLAYTAGGLGELSRAFHGIIQNHVVRGFWKNRERPILINNWEATYFDFTEKKLLSLAQAARRLGIELFVLDDGWFGRRNDDRSSLGDWYPNPEKLPDGIEGLAQKIVDLGLRFGLWIEPEMVNPDSDLYRAHPDWVVGAPCTKRTLGRNQLVLDMGRPEVVEYLYGVIAQLLRRSSISYIKWDMNRHITEPLSAALPPERQGEFFHRYILGVYELYDRLTREFPQVLFESCSSGGNRFDGGLFAYAPQAWTSDDTDAVERLFIQWGTSYFYPPSTMGAHVSAVPNHQVGRITPLWSRAFVAFFGAFGYELDIEKLSEEEQEALARQVAFYKEWRGVFQFGRFYRLRGPFWTGPAANWMPGGAGGAFHLPDNEIAWMSVSADQRRAVVLYFQIRSSPNPPMTRLPLRGLDARRLYRLRVYPARRLAKEWGPEAAIRNNEGLRRGDELMQVGLLFGGDGWAGTGRGDYAAWLVTLEAE